MDNRRKVGFNTSIKELFNTCDPNVRAQVLSEGPIFDLVKGDRIEEFLPKPTLKNSGSNFLFIFVCARLFLEMTECSRTTN